MAGLTASLLFLSSCGGTSQSIPPGKGLTPRSTYTSRTVAPVGPPQSVGSWRQATGSWLGTPYRYGGTTREGIDCSAFTQTIMQSVAGITIPRTSKEQFKVGKWVNLAELQPGDLVFFNTSGRGVSHVGIMIEGHQFAHASVSRGVTISSLNQSYYRSRLMGARRIISR